MAEKLLYTYIGSLEIGLPQQCVLDCSHQGQCDEDVSYWQAKLKLKIEPQELAKELQEYGAWDIEELADHEANLGRIIWIAAGNIKEEEAQARD